MGPLRSAFLQRRKKTRNKGSENKETMEQGEKNRPQRRLSFLPFDLYDAKESNVKTRTDKIEEKDMKRKHRPLKANVEWNSRRSILQPSCMKVSKP
jgi:hypothetical protein